MQNMTTTITELFRGSYLIMEKLADTQYPIHKLLQSRWSPIAFSEQPIESEKLLSVLEATRWTASSFNEQPWSFIITNKQNPTEFNLLLGCLADTNQQWAQNAPVLMLSVAKLHFDRNGKENRHAFYDVGAAAANLAIQATAMGLFVHQMAGFDVEKARRLFSIPDRYEPVSAIAIGYLGDPQILPAKLLQRELAPRTRKPLEKFVFSGNWGRNF
jgi:nitroreductase